MKFSREFRARQNPVWLHAYVRYDTSKTLIKALTNKAQVDSHHENSAGKSARMVKRVHM